MVAVETFGSASEVESKLKDTEGVFFLAGLSASPLICVGAIVIGGTQSFDNTISASLYICKIGYVMIAILHSTKIYLFGRYNSRCRGR